MNQSFKYGTYQKSIIFGILTKIGDFSTIGPDKIPHIDFTIKTVEYYKPKNDPTILKEFTKWHQCRAFGKMAEHIDSLQIEVGDLLKVEGPFDYSRTTDISSAINQFVTIKVSSIHLILKGAEATVSQNILEEDVDSFSDVQFDYEPIKEPTDKIDVK